MWGFGECMFAGNWMILQNRTRRSWQCVHFDLGWFLEEGAGYMFTYNFVFCKLLGGVHLYKSEVAELFFCSQNFLLVLPCFSVCCSSRIPSRWQRLVKGSPIRPKRSTLQESPCESAGFTHMCNKLAAVLKSSSKMFKAGSVITKHRHVLISIYHTFGIPWQRCQGPPPSSANVLRFVSADCALNMSHDPKILAILLPYTVHSSVLGGVVYVRGLCQPVIIYGDKKPRKGSRWANQYKSYVIFRDDSICDLDLGWLSDLKKGVI